ncbi:MAG: ABC transporter permease [Methanotrichaceae archaeon]|nr:ABC transporter permease [Methanotrichaceae archaeon]
MWFIQYRELIKNLSISDLKIKYQSSILGFAWSLLNPLLMMLVLYAVFNNFFNTTQEHYALYLLIGITTWRFFSVGTSIAMGSIVSKPSLVTKIYIPRKILVLSTVLSGFITSLLEFLVLIILLLIFGVSPSKYIIIFPLAHIMYCLLVYGISLALAASYVYYRDLNQIWDVLLQVGFFLSPIIYPISMVPEQYMNIYMLNPITAIMLIYRDILLYGTAPSYENIAILVISAVITLILGGAAFMRLQRRFAEEI